MVIEQLKEGDLIESSSPLRVIVSKIFQGLTQKGAPYCNLTLSDRTGQLDLMIWDTTKEKLLYQEGDILELLGTITSYNNTLQIKSTRVTKVDNDDPYKYLPGISDELRKKLLEKLYDYVDKVALLSNSYYALLAELFRTNENFRTQFIHAPASVLHHNAFIGGLLEHTIRVVDIADAMLPNNALVITGAILHDCGKVWEYQSYPVISVNHKNALVGHIVLLLQFLPRVIQKLRKEGNIEFSRDDEYYLYHCIASHHGKLEYGSPVIPMIEEAIVIAEADIVAGRLENYTQEIQKITPGKSEWSQLAKQFYYRR